MLGQATPRGREAPDDSNRARIEPEYVAAMPRRPMRPNEISSGGVVVRASPEGYEVCLVSDGKYWGFPKGHVEPGETPEAAAMREISEETGIPLESLVLRAPLPPSEYVYRRPNRGALVFKRVHHFIVEAPEGTIARPRWPDARRTSTSTVGFPRESSTCRPFTSAIALTVSPWPCRSRRPARRAGASSSLSDQRPRARPHDRPVRGNAWRQHVPRARDRR